MTGLPGEQSVASRRAPRTRDCGNLDPTHSHPLPSPPRPPLPTVRFSLGLSRFSAYGPFPAPASS